MHKDNDELRAPSSESLEAGYETSGVSTNGLMIFLVCLIGFAVILHVGIWFGVRAITRIQDRLDRATTALNDPKLLNGRPFVTQAAPPPPRLQPNPEEKEDQRVPAADLQLMYRTEDEVFRSMGWTIREPDHAQVQIPPEVIAAVIREETERQQQQAKRRGVSTAR